MRKTIEDVFNECTENVNKELYSGFFWKGRRFFNRYSRMGKYFYITELKGYGMYLQWSPDSGWNTDRLNCSGRSADELKNTAINEFFINNLK